LDVRKLVIVIELIDVENYYPQDKNRNKDHQVLLIIVENIIENLISKKDTSPECDGENKDIAGDENGALEKIHDDNY